jgi:uncharacterized membrane protein YccC
MPRQDINAALIGTTILLAVGIFVLDFIYPLGVAVGALYTPLVLITLWSSSRRFTLIVTVGATVLTVVGLFYPLYGGANWLAVTNRVLSLITIWVAAILVLLYKRAEEERERLIRELQDALENIKTLRGLLPICSSCKKIRDDHGYWNQLETYIGAHTDAEFTHGLCPECIQKLYPDYSERK